MTGTDSTILELDDIQSGALYERPSPYVGTYLLLRIDDRAAGRELVRRLHAVAESQRASADPAHDTSITVAFTYGGLQALGVQQTSLDSFGPEFRAGMAARAAELGDVGDSSPENWEKPLGTADVHVAVAVLSPDAARHDLAVEQGSRAQQELSGIELVWRQDCYQLPTGRTSFGFKDGIGQPAVEGSGRPSSNPRKQPLKAGEIILGYADESGELPPMPTPEVLVATAPTSSSGSCTRGWWRTGSTWPHAQPAAPTRRASARRWSGAGRAAPRSRSHRPTMTPSSATTRTATTTSVTATTPRGFKCPVGAHARRANPRDAFDGDGSVDVRLHRMIRRGTSYGPMLPEGVLEDDGVDRGIMFVFAGAHLKRQFEFVKTQWLNDGIFIGTPLERDPLVGPNDGSGVFTVPERPIRRRLNELPPFVITRGGEYCFVPGLRAMRWLADLES